MSPISDDELSRNLARRSADQLPPGQRDALLSAAAVARTRRRSWSFRPALLLAPAAVAVVLAVLAYPLLLASAPSPNASPSASSAPTVIPTAEPSGAPHVYTAQQLSDMIGDPAWVGHFVLAQARIGNMMSGLPCTAPDPCEIATLGGLSPGSKNVVLIGWRDAPDGEGVQIAGPRRVEPLAIPRQPGVFAFRVAIDSVEYLGPVVENNGELVRSVDGVQAGSHADPTDDLYAVHGWLTQTPPVPCPAPADFSGDTDYWCGGSFMTAQPVDWQSATNNLNPGGLHVQYTAYDDFAPNPQRGGIAIGPLGTVPREGTYLVRSAGCQANVWDGACPVWRLVGRLDQTELPTPTATPSPNATSLPIPVLDAQQLEALSLDPGSFGRVVAANVRLAPMPMPSSTEPCDPPTACLIGQLGDVGDEIDVLSGWRDTSVDAGTYLRSQQRWLVRLQVPTADLHLMAFLIGDRFVEYLGPVIDDNGERVWSLNDLPAIGNVAADSLYAVDGWLVQTIIANCPAPNGAIGQSDLNYYCGGSFITASETPASQVSNVFDLGGLHVQWDAYDRFALNATQNAGRGTEPRRGIYLVRPVGDRPTVGGDSSVWHLVGRVDPIGPEPTPAP